MVGEHDLAEKPAGEIGSQYEARIAGEVAESDAPDEPEAPDDESTQSVDEDGRPVRGETESEWNYEQRMEAFLGQAGNAAPSEAASGPF